MARPNMQEEQRGQLLPVLAQAFAELGYRKATTAELARRCRVRENILYRLWDDKKAMFIASIEFVYESSEDLWHEALTTGSGRKTSAERLVQFEADRPREFGLHRIIFAGLSETHDPDIQDALRRMYARYHLFISRQIGEHRARRGRNASKKDTHSAAWGMIGVGTMVSIATELEILPPAQLGRLLSHLGRTLLDGP